MNGWTAKQATWMVSNDNRDQETTNRNTREGSFLNLNGYSAASCAQFHIQNSCS